MASWSRTSKLVIKCTKCNSNFTALDKMPKQWFINQVIVFSLYLYKEIKKSCNSVFFQTIDVRLWTSQGFPETLRYWDYLSLLNWIIALTLPLLLQVLQSWSLDLLYNFLSSEIVLYLCKTSIWPCLEYCCHISVCVPSCYLEAFFISCVTDKQVALLTRY